MKKLIIPLVFTLVGFVTMENAFAGNCTDDQKAKMRKGGMSEVEIQGLCGKQHGEYSGKWKVKFVITRSDLVESKNTHYKEWIIRQKGNNFSIHEMGGNDYNEVVEKSYNISNVTFEGSNLTFSYDYSIELGPSGKKWERTNVQLKFTGPASFQGYWQSRSLDAFEGDSFLGGMFDGVVGGVQMGFQRKGTIQGKKIRN